jgi:hypothetical protein
MSNQIKCARQIMNYSTIDRQSRFDKKTFDPDILLDNLSITSPKLVSMLKQIEELDSKDYKRDRKLYKHYIYSGVGNGYGSKIIASAMIAAGYALIQKPQGSKIVIDNGILNSKNEAKLAVLSSTALWNTSTNLKATKELLAVYNKRPENVYGNLVRFIILDSGFKEGIDLFDVKYAHIFEDQINESDVTQSNGRGLRFCGQKGLPFIKGKGWTVNIYTYVLYKVVKGKGFAGLWNNLKNLNFNNTRILDNKEPILMALLAQNKELEFKINFEKDITKLIQDASVDCQLNKNINNYQKNSTNTKAILAITLAVILGTVGIVGTRYLHRKSVMKTNVKDFELFVKRFGKSKM